MGKYVRKLEEEVKSIKSEIEENVQGTNSDSKETGTQVNGFGAEGRNKHSTITE